MPDMWESLEVEAESSDPHAHAYRREAMAVSVLWQEIPAKTPSGWSYIQPTQSFDL